MINIPTHLRLLLLLSVTLLLNQACNNKTAAVTITIDAEKIENRIPSFLYGSCIEDVNHEIYGGLYDQKIFGESFEEPEPSPEIENFTVHEGVWKATNNEVFVLAFSGAKLIYNPTDVTKGYAETEIKFNSKNDGNAGFITRVTKPGKGADNFYGYEISLKADGKKIVFAKHKNNFEHIQDIDVDCNPLQWNRLKAMMDNGKIELLLNDKSVFTYSDNDTLLTSGKVGLRTWNADVSFKNVKIKSGKGEATLSFKTPLVLNLSSQWDAIQTGDSKVLFVHDTRDAFNGKCSQTVQLIPSDGNAGVANKGLNRWGIAVSNGQQYNGSIYLKSNSLEGPVTVALQSADGQMEYAAKQIQNISSKWEKYTFELTANSSDTNARFAVYFNQPGKLWIDQVTLMNTPKDQFKGLPFRKDISEALVAQGLTFLRYGGSMINAPEYRFKKMIGDPGKRPPYKGTWYNYSTNGFGIEDFLKFCEAAGFTASFAVNIEETPADMADMVEYLNGPATSTWGKKRAENGHPAPYNVKYIEIGNEEVLGGGDNAAGYDHYIQRFNLLHNAMKSKDSSIMLINAAWWRPKSPNIEKVFKALDGKAAYWDYHPWAENPACGRYVERELKHMRELFLKWNPNTTMKCAIFEENGNIHNMQRALAHVSLQNAVRKMGDFVLTSCAANALQPYKQNDNGWDQGQIFFTPTQVWGMPPFYAQKIASENHLPLRVSSAASNDTLDITATRDENGNKLILHIANIHEAPITASITIKGFENISSAKAVYLTGKPGDVNSPEKPEFISPKTKELKAGNTVTFEFEPYSYTILIFTK